VAGQPVTAAHLPQLSYTRMVLQELVRLYPVGWLIPRTATRRDVIGRHVVKPGSTILISPYLTQRLDGFWDRPTEFDPDRFRPENARGRHRFAYFPFGGGPHQCLGSHLFTVEAELIAATILSRYRPELANATPVTAFPAASLRPREQVLLTLRPIEVTPAMPRVA
jgi:cytochrome P450